MALNMSLCDYLIVEEKTRKVSLIGCFSALPAVAFPTGPRRFFVYADLTDGRGHGTAELVIAHSASETEVYRQARPIRFPDALWVVQCGWKVDDCSFPYDGRYVVAILVDGEWVTQRTLDLVSTGGPS
jgi:hypothetical protein